jgi:hypothetical protein
MFGPPPAARHGDGGGTAVSPIKCWEPYPPPRATMPRTAPTATSLRPLRCHPQPPRSAPTRPPSCTMLGRHHQWAADAEMGWPRWMAATEAGIASTGAATEARMASTGGGLGVEFGGLDGRPRWRPRCGAGASAVTSTCCGHFSGDLDAGGSTLKHHRGMA